MKKRGISCVLSESGELKTNQDLILVQIEELHASNNQSESHQAAPEIPEVTQSEVRHALNLMPNGKASGPEGLSIETLKSWWSFSRSTVIKSIHQMLERK